MKESEGASEDAGEPGSPGSRLTPFQTAQSGADRHHAVSALAIGLCHDLNNLLLPVRSHLRLLRASVASKELERSLDALDQAEEMLRGLVHEVRLLTNPERPQFTGQTDLEGWWRQVEGLLRTLARDGIELVAAFTEGLPAVRLRPTALSRIVVNLITNSIEAIDDQGRIEIAARSGTEPDTVVMTVTDNGRGMEPDSQRQALLPFFTTKARSPGVGLGLSIVESSVREVGGRVAIGSEPGRGTTIELILPVAAKQERMETQRPLTARVTLGDERLAALFRSLLVLAGYELVGEPTLSERLTVWASDSASCTPAEVELATRERGLERFILFEREVGDAWTGLDAWTVDPGAGLQEMREIIARLPQAERER